MGKNNAGKKGAKAASPRKGGGKKEGKAASPKKAGAAVPRAATAQKVKACLPRNRKIATGINRLSRSAAHSKTKRYERKYNTPKPVVAKKSAGKSWYPTEDKKHSLPSSRAARNGKRTTNLRASITPGTVLIVLAGRFAGKRVVFLKQLKSGLLAVTGPFKLNGVPVRRLNQAYVIGTSTKIDLSNVDGLDQIEDSLFARAKVGSEGFLSNAQTAVVSPLRKKLQTAVDSGLTSTIKQTPLLAEYLSSRFSLSNNDRPHLMSF
jgi:large subunit ribosomal protein L6e